MLRVDSGQFLRNESRKPEFYFRANIVPFGPQGTERKRLSNGKFLEPGFPEGRLLSVLQFRACGGFAGVEKHSRYEAFTRRTGAPRNVRAGSGAGEAGREAKRSPRQPGREGREPAGGGPGAASRFRGCSRPRVLPVSPAPRALLPAAPAPRAPPGGADPARSRGPPGPRALLPAAPAPAPRARSGGAGREERAPGPRAARAAGLLGVLGSVRILGAGDVRLAGSFEG